MRMVTVYPLKPKTQDTAYLESVWETINYISCPYSFNFHMHTNASDGKLTPISLVQQAIAIGLQGFAITDHHSVAGYRTAEQYLQELTASGKIDNPPHLWTGIEITSKLLEVEVHILGYGFDPEHSSIVQYLTGEKPQGKIAYAKQVVDSIHQAGGLVVLAHPERYRRSANTIVPVMADLGIDGIETYYAYNNPKIWQPSPAQTERVQALAEKYCLYNTCGTDTHGTNLLQKV